MTGGETQPYHADVDQGSGKQKYCRRDILGSCAKTGGYIVDGKGKAQQKSFLGRQNGRIRTVDSLGDVIRGKLWLLAAMGGEGIVKFVQ